jgi:proline dehydrogenase
MKILYPFAKRFIAGYNFDSAKPIIAKLHSEGYEVSIDYLGELSKTRDDCLEAFIQYCNIIDYYRDKFFYYNPFQHSTDISIKPSQLGLRFDKEYCYDLMEKIVRKAKSFDMTIRLDMEDDTLIQSTIDLCLHLNKKYKNVGVAIQTNMFRTKSDIAKLMVENISMRLVKGAYKEDITKAYQKKEQIKKLFVQNAFTILSDRCRTYYHMGDNNKAVSAIGTHDEDILKEITKNMGIFNIKKEDCDFEFLYGIRRDLSRKMKDDGYRVRLYVPFGTKWLPYTLRRLKEYKNLIFVITNIFKEWKR